MKYNYSFVRIRFNGRGSTMKCREIGSVEQAFIRGVGAVAFLYIYIVHIQAALKPVAVDGAVEVGGNGDLCNPQTGIENLIAHLRIGQSDGFESVAVFESARTDIFQRFREDYLSQRSTVSESSVSYPDNPLGDISLRDARDGRDHLCAVGREIEAVDQPRFFISGRSQISEVATPQEG